MSFLNGLNVENLFQAMQNDQSLSTMMRSLSPRQNPIGEAVFDELLGTRADMGFEEFQYTGGQEFQTLTEEGSVPRCIPAGYTTYAFSFCRSTFNLRKNEPITRQNFVPELRSYRDRSEMWLKALSTFIKQVDELDEFAREHRYCISISLNENYFLVEMIAPDNFLIFKRWCRIFTSDTQTQQAGSSPTAPLVSNPLFQQRNGPPVPEFLTPHGPQDFDENGDELSPRHLEPMQSCLGPKHFASPTSPQAPASSRNKEATKESPGRTTKTGQTPKTPANRRRRDPKTPSLRTPETTSRSSEPPSTVSRPSKKRARKVTIKKESKTPEKPKKIAAPVSNNSPNAKEESGSSLVDSLELKQMPIFYPPPPVAANGFNPFFNRNAMLQAGSTYPSCPISQILRSSHRGLSDSPSTLTTENY